MHSRFILRALPLVLGLAGCAAPPDDFDFETCGVRPRAELIVEMQGGVPVTTARVKGQPARLVLDTGATGLVLTESAAVRLGVGRSSHVTVSSVGAGGGSRNFAGVLEEFEIAGLKVPDHQIAVLPPNAGIAVAGTVDGLFGVSVLSIFEIELDLARRRVVLHAGRLCPDTVAPSWTASAAVLDAGQSQRGRFIVPVTLYSGSRPGRTVAALLDTGAARSVVARDVALSIGVDDDMLARDPPVRLVGVGPNVPVGRLHRFATLDIAGHALAAPHLIVVDRAETGMDMILGSDFLAGRRIWLSYARKRVFIDFAPR